MHVSVCGHVCRQASVWQHLGLPKTESSSGIPSHLCPWECFLSSVFTKRPRTCAQCEGPVFVTCRLAFYLHCALSARTQAVVERLLHRGLTRGMGGGGGGGKKKGSSGKGLGGTAEPGP